MFADMMRYGTESGQRLFDGKGVTWGNRPMMWGFGSDPGVFWFFSILWVTTWVLVIVVLIALIRWLWKKGDKVH